MERWAQYDLKGAAFFGCSFPEGITNRSVRAKGAHVWKEPANMPFQAFRRSPSPVFTVMLLYFGIFMWVVCSVHVHSEGDYRARRGDQRALWSALRHRHQARPVHPRLLHGVCPLAHRTMDLIQLDLDDIVMPSTTTSRPRRLWVSWAVTALPAPRPSTARRF